jgi:hypothetical protein
MGFMRFLRLAAAASVVALGLAAAAPSQAATIWDAVADFSTTSSTGVNGVWSYGWDGGAGFTAYSTMTQNGGTCFAGISCWQSPGPDLAYSVPLVAKTIGPGIVNFLTVVQPSDVLNLHPGATQPDMLTDIDSIVRFTAPTAGHYSFSGFFEALDTNPSGVTITAAGTPVFISGAASHPSTDGPKTYFSGNQLLTAGQTLDFRVNRDGAIWNDSTGLAVTVSVPEPASWALMIGGFGMAGAMLRRRRAQPALARV